MKSTPRLLFTALLLVAGARSLAAQQIDSPYRFVENSQGVGLLAGLVSPAKGPLGLGPESGPAFGARYGINVTGPFMAELEVLFSPTTRSVVDTAFTSGADSTHVVVGEADMNLLVAMASIRFNITGSRSWHGIQPYVLAGGGVATDLAGDAEADEEVAADVRFDFGSSFAAQLGLGAEYHFSPRWTARADARSAFWKLKNPTAFRLQDEENVLPADQWESNTVLTAGISFRF